MAGNAAAVSYSSALAMARRRKTVVFFILLVAISPPFLSERPTSSPTLPGVPRDFSSRPLYSEHSERLENVSRLLLSPTFVFHLLWIVGLCLLTAFAIVDLLLKVVFTGCTLGVLYATSDSLPAIPIKSRYA